MVALARRHRFFTLVAAAAAVLIVVIVGLRSTGPALATSGSDPYVVPLVTDTNPDPDIVETTITAEPASVDLGNGVTASALTFNGLMPGPEFRLKVGDTVIVHFVNNLGHPSGIHWHGIELGNPNDGTPLTQNMVPPGWNLRVQVQGHPSGHLLVSPASPLVDEPGVQGSVWVDHRDRSE